jgi:hypothetical protein
MHLAFWNNPIIVSAFRVKYRRGGLSAITALYLLALVVGGAVLDHYLPPTGPPWARVYFLCIMVVQFLLSGILAGVSTASAIKSEVSQRTLDFQRIASLSPQQILLGKLLGEPAVAYLLAIATIPLSILCCLSGGVGPDILVLMYVNLASNTILFGALGLLNRLEDTSGKPVATGQGIAWIFIPIIFLIPGVSAGTSLFSVPWVGAVEGLLTPLQTFFGVARGQPLLYGLSFFDVQIPYILITPWSQLFVAYLCFRSMVRQLINPLNPPISKPMAYLLLALWDLLAAAALYDTGAAGLAVGPRVAAFCLANLTGAIILVQGMTPWRETLQSWLWRYRRRQHAAWYRWVGDRSPNGPALMVFCIEGIFLGALLVLLPAAYHHGWNNVAAVMPEMLWVTATMVIMIVSLGILYQWIVLLAGRGGLGTMLTLVSLAVVVPHLVGEYYQIDWVTAFSPSAHFSGWLFGRLLNKPLLNPVPMLAAYMALGLLLEVSLRRRLSRLGRQVDRKLEQMGVPGYGTPASDAPAAEARPGLV